MPSHAPILLIGGTRGTGLLIARLLLQQGAPIRVLARDPARARRELGPAPEVIAGDITQEETLLPAVTGAAHIIFTAGCRSGLPVTRSQVRRTEYEGVVNTLDAARRVGFDGRLLYMTASGAAIDSFWSLALNIWKGNTLAWRERAESAIRASGLAYTIIRTGMLTNRAGGRQAIVLTQEPLPLSPRYRLARADAAAAFVAALRHPRTVRATFEIVEGKGDASPHWPDLLDRVRPDDEGST